MAQVVLGSVEGNLASAIQPRFDHDWKIRVRLSDQDNQVDQSDHVHRDHLWHQEFPENQDIHEHLWNPAARVVQASHEVEFLAHQGCTAYRMHEVCVEAER